MSRIILERTFDPPISEADWEEAHEKVEPCLEQYSVRWIRSLMSRDRRRTICEFEAPDAEAIRASFRKAGVPFGRAWTAEVFEP